jgi:hypothetical protein
LSTAGATIGVLRKILSLAVVAFGLWGAMAPTAAGAVRTLYVSVGAGSESPCTRSEPCGSFDRAYKVARPGDRVVIGGGVYPEQVIRVDARKLLAQRPVTFTVAKNASVVVQGDLKMLGSNAVFEGSKRRGGSYSFRARRVVSEIASSLGTTSRNVTFKHLKAETFVVTGTRNITFQGGDYGPSVACWPRGKTGVGPLGGPITPAMWCPVGSGYEITGNTDGFEPRIGPSGAVKASWPRNITLSGITIHDQNSLDYVNLHTGGLFLVSGRGLRIENSLFHSNIVYDVMAQDFTTPDCCAMSFGAFRDVVIRRNRFRAPVNAALQEGGNGWTNRKKNDLPELVLEPRGEPWRNWLIERNSFENGIAFAGAPSFQNVVLRRNVGGGSACFPGASGFTWEQNVMSSPCGGAPVPFGYSLRNGELRPVGEAAATVRRIFEAASGGATAAEVARRVQRAPAPDHGRWTAETIRRVIGDRRYVGDAVGPPQAHPRLVSPARWRSAQRGLR